MIKLKSTNGFGLIGVMVLASVFILISLAIVRMVSQSANLNTHIKHVYTAQMLRLAIMEHLRDFATCNQNFGNNVYTINDVDGSVGPAVSQILDRDGGVLLAEGQMAAQLTDFSLRVEEINLIDFQPRSAAERRRGALALEIIFRKEGPLLGNRHLRRVIELAVTKQGFFDDNDTDHRIATCAAVGNHGQSPWVMSGSGDATFGVWGLDGGPEDDQNQFRIGIGENPNYAPARVSPNSHKIAVEGNIFADDFVYPSDRKFKKHFLKIDAFKILNAIRGVRFRRKWDGKISHGVIAQELEKVMPEAVHTMTETGLKAVDYNQLLAPLIAALQQLDSENKQLMNEVLAEEKKIDNLLKKNGPIR